MYSNTTPTKQNGHNFSLEEKWDHDGFQELETLGMAVADDDYDMAMMEAEAAADPVGDT